MIKMALNVLIFLHPYNIFFKFAFTIETLTTDNRELNNRINTKTDHEQNRAWSES